MTETTEPTGFVTLPKNTKPSKSLSKDAARPGLQVAKVTKEGDQWVLYSCDSFQLARLPLHVEGEGAITEGIITADALKAVEKAGGFRANGTVEPVNQFGRSTGQTFARPTEEVVGRMPKFAQLIPDAPAPADTLTIGLSAKKLRELADSLGANKHGEVLLTIDMSTLQEDERTGGKQLLRPALVSTNTANDAQGLLMPVRHS